MANSAVNAPKLAAGSVTTAKIANSAIATGKLATASVTAAKIAANAVKTTKLTTAAVGVVGTRTRRGEPDEARRFLHFR